MEPRPHAAISGSGSTDRSAAPVRVCRKLDVIPMVPTVPIVTMVPMVTVFEEKSRRSWAFDLEVDRASSD